MKGLDILVTYANMLQLNKLILKGTRNLNMKRQDFSVIYVSLQQQVRDVFELWVYEIMEGGMPLGLVLENLVFGGRSRASLLFFCI